MFSGIRALIDFFGPDDRRIEHAFNVTKWAVRILAVEGADEDVVLAAALFHDVGIKEAEARFGYNNGKLQEEFGPPIAREILTQLGMPEARIAEVCAVIGSHHTPEGVPGAEFPIIWDADMIVNLSDEMAGADPDKLESIIDKSFKTKTGKQLARRALLPLAAK